MSVREIFTTMDYGPAPESPDEARLWLRRHKETLHHFIAGEWSAPDSGEPSASA